MVCADSSLALRSDWPRRKQNVLFHRTTTQGRIERGVLSRNIKTSILDYRGFLGLLVLSELIRLFSAYSTADPPVHHL